MSEPRENLAAASVAFVFSRPGSQSENLVQSRPSELLDLENSGTPRRDTCPVVLILPTIVKGYGLELRDIRG